jgi:hypothetical protein
MGKPRNLTCLAGELSNCSEMLKRRALSLQTSGIREKLKEILGASGIYMFITSTRL